MRERAPATQTAADDYFRFPFEIVKWASASIPGRGGEWEHCVWTILFSHSSIDSWNLEFDLFYRPLQVYRDQLFWKVLSRVYPLHYSFMDTMDMYMVLHQFANWHHYLTMDCQKYTGEYIDLYPIKCDPVKIPSQAQLPWTSGEPDLQKSHLNAWSSTNG